VGFANLSAVDVDLDDLAVCIRDDGAATAAEEEASSCTKEDDEVRLRLSNGRERCEEAGWPTSKLVAVRDGTAVLRAVEDRGVRFLGELEEKVTGTASTSPRDYGGPR
jgi:hypothetical protein